MWFAVVMLASGVWAEVAVSDGGVPLRRAGITPRKKLNALVVMLRSEHPTEGPFHGAGLVISSLNQRLQILSVAHLVRHKGEPLLALTASFVYSGDTTRPSEQMPVTILNADEAMDVALLEANPTADQLQQIGELDFDLLADVESVPSNVGAVMVGFGERRPWNISFDNRVVNDPTDPQILFQSPRVTDGFSGGALATNAPEMRLLGLIQGKDGDEWHGRALNIVEGLRIARSWGATPALQAPIPTEIVSFQALTPVVPRGTNSVLKWTTRGAQRCVIDPLGAVEPIGSQTARVTATTTYVLTCKGSMGEASRSIVVKVHDQPTELVLTSNPTRVSSSQSTKLEWTSSGLDGCVLLDGSAAGLGPVPSSGKKDIVVAATTQFGIRCRASDQTELVRSATVTVVPPAVLKRFEAQPMELLSGRSGRLKWEVTGATDCTIRPELGTVAMMSEAVITPREDTTYVLACASPSGELTRSVKVSVKAPVRIVLFDGPVESTEAGTLARFEWSAENALACTLDGATVATAGTKGFRDQVSTTHVLSCSGPGGPVVSRVSSNVHERLAITSFEATPSSIAAGDQALLEWSSTGASSCTIDHGVGSVETSDSTEVRPRTNMTYKLTCRSAVTSVSKTVRVGVSSQLFCCDQLGIRRCPMVVPSLAGGPCFCMGLGNGFVCQ